MRGLFSIMAGMAVVFATPAYAQSNNDDYTPLNSRIKRDRQFPLDMPNRFDPERMTRVMRDRSKDMLAQLSRCLYNRSNDQALALLETTDFGFADFAQVDLEPDRALRIYGFSDCLRRVATSHNMSVQLRFTPGALRQWLLQQAYLDRYPNGPTWVVPGNIVGERVFPLSGNSVSVLAVMDFADCVVQADPYSADFFYRAAGGSDDEKAAIADLTPALGPCLPRGQQVELTPATLRAFLGEGLWHAANTIAPAPAEESQDSN